MDRISNDATVSSVKDLLTNKVAYVVGVFHQMHECNRDNGSAYVRIGVMGAGKSPHYRVEYDVVGQASPIAIHGSYDGRNHRDLVDEDQLRDANWSSQRMNFDEVRELLAEVRPPKKVNG